MKSGSECTWLDIEDRLQKFYLYVSGVFAESARAKETFGEMNKARIYKGEQQIRGAHPDYKRVWSDFVQNLWTLSRGEENSVLVYVLFNVPEELSSES